MKRLLFLVWLLFTAVSLASQSQTDLSTDLSKDWTDEQFRQYEDSVRRELYAPVIAHKTDSAYQKDNGGSGEVPPSKLPGSNVPSSLSIDKNLSVGQIVIKSGTSQTGARTYEVPIDVYPGMNGLTPTVSLTYNSQQGSSVVGTGWAVSGISMISRCGKSVYYDKKAEGVVMSTSDAFMLDGIRLIMIEPSSYILYESEYGNIKVKGYHNAGVLKYFEVFYPDGKKGVFGFPSNTVNQLYYPLTSLTDLNGNEISYSYSFADNHYNISEIAYNGASVRFSYKTREDPFVYYRGGLKVVESQLLSQISSKLGNVELGRYLLTHSVRNDRSYLTDISYSCSGKSYNPLRFYYGQGDDASVYTTSTTRLVEWYTSDDPAMIKVSRGKFNYGSGDDGLIVLPNYNPYWKHHRHSTWTRHTQDYFDNLFSGDEKIFLYTDLKEDDWASPMPNLITGNGFVDILCADLEGNQEDYVIKVNNYVSNSKDHVVFQLYKSNLHAGLVKSYTRSYDFPTVYEDPDGNKSIQPKFYYAGDFNGDGRMEIMAVSAHQPFGETERPSMCYVFDLINNNILYQAHLLTYNVDFVGTTQTDPQAAADNTDKLFVIDYDGDGKSDICHINEKGTDIYTFIDATTFLNSRKLTTYPDLKRKNLAGKDVMPCEYNGDGLTDILVSPTAAGITWTIYNSTGDGGFESSTFSGPLKISADNCGFLIQDVNIDGITDLIKYTPDYFETYLTVRNASTTQTTLKSFPSSKSILVPTDINSHDCFTQLVSLKEGIVTKYSFSRNDNTGSLMTGMANSLGVIEKNFYGLIDASGVADNYYTKGSDATYPYVNIMEPLPVLKSSEVYLNGKSIDYNSFVYHNAVLHRQGLGFRGFEKITHTNRKGQQHVRTYEPYRYCLLKDETTPEFAKTYTYSVSTEYNKLARITQTGRTEKDKLKDITATYVFESDSYGYPTSELITYPGDITVLKKNTYASNTTVGDGYNLGYLRDQTVTVTRNGTQYKERKYVAAFNKRQPTVTLYYKDGNKIREEIYQYDSHGNPTSETVKLFSSPNSLKTVFEYDSYGRLSKETSPLGLSNRYTYDSSGKVASSTDSRGAVTTYTYDLFGRKESIKYPDGTLEKVSYAWAPVGSDRLYSITETKTGSPTTIEFFDALNRPVRKGDIRFDGRTRYVDVQYDAYGRPEKESLPFFGDSPSKWNTYSYDSHDRILSCAEASGRTTTYSYSGCSVTTVEDGISTTKTYDALENVVAVSDPAGTVTYNLAADGQPTSIVAPGNVVTSFGYDSYRRQTSLSDPSQGTTTYGYDAAGNLSTETNANGEVTTNEFDSYNRLKKTTTPEFVTTYAYTAYDELSSISTDNGTSKTFAYDSIGRISTLTERGVDGTMLQKSYGYSDGNVSSVTYRSQRGLLGTETYIYTNGHITKALFNGDSYYILSEENSFGKPTKINALNLVRDYSYTDYGLPSGQTASGVKGLYQNTAYVFDHTTSCLMRRTDDKRKISEAFSYDNLNRLIIFGNNGVTYDAKGNITHKSGVGTFGYNIAQKPYAVSDVTLFGDAIPQISQEISYSSFRRPSAISERGMRAAFVYNGEYKRVRMILTTPGAPDLRRYYLGDCYEMDSRGTDDKEKLYLSGDYYSAPAVLVRDKTGTKLYHILRDYLGSITHIIDKDGTVVQELSYDAWGRLRDPETQTIYSGTANIELFLGRGYTGHEHLVPFGLINMNARLYDPVLGRFLSPDPFVQEPFMSQNFNRFSYALNNPLCYVDEDGESLIAVIACIVGAYIGGVLSNHGELNPLQWNYKSAGTYLGMAFGAFGGYAIGAGMINIFTFNACTPYISAGVAAGAVGGGTDWDFTFTWSTAAGGGGRISNINSNYAISVNEGIDNARWNHSAYQYAAMATTILLADDATVVGAADDVLIPAFYLYYMFLSDEMIGRRDKQIARLAEKERPGYGYVYQLEVKKDGWYNNVRSNSLVYMKTGEVWKYGETTQGNNRYSINSYETKNFHMRHLFFGTKTEILIEEKNYLYKYYIEHGQLPPGNKRFQ